LYIFTSLSFSPAKSYYFIIIRGSHNESSGKNKDYQGIAKVQLFLGYSSEKKILQPFGIINQSQICSAKKLVALSPGLLRK
jgi:hypothetical protein